MQAEVARLVVSWPALRLRFVRDEEGAIEAVKELTRALAEQPYNNASTFLASFGAGKGSQGSK
jgi:hypothetical protein